MFFMRCHIAMPTNALEKLSALTGQSAADLKNVAEHYPFAITPFLARRAQEGSYSAAALRQFVPDVRELLTIDGFTPDPPARQRCVRNRPFCAPTTTVWPSC